VYAILEARMGVLLSIVFRHCFSDYFRTTTWSSAFPKRKHINSNIIVLAMGDHLCSLQGATNRKKHQ